jgi:hypothetical protein
MDVWNMLITPQKPKVKLSWQSSREAGSRILLLSNNLYGKDFRKSKSFEETPIAGPTQPRSLLFTRYAISQSANMENHRGPRIAHMKWKHQQLWNQRKIVAVSWLWRTHTYPLNKCNEYNVVQSPMQVVHEFGHASIDGHCPSYIRGKAHFVLASCLGQAFLHIFTVHMTYLISIFHCLHFYPLFVLHFNFLDPCFSRASFHPSSFLDLSFFFFFFFPFFIRKHNNKPDPQAIGTPK